MKRVGNIFEKILNINNLTLAAYDTFKGKSTTVEVKNFRNDFFQNILRIREDLLQEKAEFGNYRKFVIFEPKKRIISAAPLAQRIIHHGIMNICHKYFDCHLIYDSYASRPGKGTHKAIRRVQSKIRHHKYFAKLDVKKFFDSIDHSILKKLLRRIFKDEAVLRLFDNIIDSHNEIKGLPIGNLTSQYFANYYLSFLDHYMKEVVKAPVYVRYMDDVIIMGESKEQISYLVEKYKNYASEKLKLQIKPPIIGLTSNGILFLGFKIYAYKLLLSGKGKRRFIKNINNLNSLFIKSYISENEYTARINSCLNFVTFADSYNFRKRVINRLNVNELVSR